MWRLYLSQWWQCAFLKNRGLSGTQDGTMGPKGLGALSSNLLRPSKSWFVAPETPYGYSPALWYYWLPLGIIIKWKSCRGQTQCARPQYTEVVRDYPSTYQSSSDHLDLEPIHTIHRHVLKYRLRSEVSSINLHHKRHKLKACLYTVLLLVTLHPPNNMRSHLP